jgi:hypothetical protein
LPRDIRWDVEIFDKDGTLIAQLKGLVSAAVGRIRKNYPTPAFRVSVEEQK